MRLFLTVALAMSASGCSQKGVKVTFDAVPPADSQLATLELRVEGDVVAPAWTGTLDVAGRFQNGTLRWIYLPGTANVPLIFQVEGYDQQHSHLVSARGQVLVTDGSADLTIYLVGPAADLAVPLDLTPSDLAVGDSGPSDMPDMSMPDMSKPDMTVPDMSAVDMKAPIPMTGLLLWVKADYGVTIDPSGSTVLTWNDQSGNNNHLSQPTKASQPLLVANTLAGKPVLRFDGANDVLNLQSTVTTVRTVFIVHRWTATSGEYRPLLGNNVPLYDYHGGGVGCGVVTNLFGPGCAAPAVLNGSGFVNDMATAPSAMTRLTTFKLITLLPMGNTSVSNLSQDRNFVGRNFYGDVAELILYNAALSAADRMMVESYLLSKYGL